MERELIGQGSEHYVLRKSNSRFVVKLPTEIGLMSLRLNGRGIEALDNEREFWENMIADSPVRIPTTRVFKRQKDYVMGQRFVEEDSSVDNIEEYLKSLGLDLLAKRYYLNPDNFRSNRGVIYYLDPTKSMTYRLIERFFKIPFPTIIDLVWRFQRLKRKIS